MKVAGTAEAIRSGQAIGLAAVFVLCAAEIAAAQSNAPTPIRLASRSLDATAAALALGKPVVVTRSDVESPLGRVRSLEFDTPASGPVRPADPAFKAVLLTPRESTGRPAQPIMPDNNITPDASAVDPAPPGAPAKPDPKQKEGMRLQSYSPADAEAAKPPAPAKPLAQPRPSTQQPKRERAVVATAPPHVAPRPAAPAPAPRAAAPRYGAAEIAATRAFTRF